MEKLYLIFNSYNIFFRKYFLSIVVIFALGCSDQKSDNAILSNINDERTLNLPSEFIIEDYDKDYEILSAQAKLNKDIIFVLQRTPSIFSNRKNNFSTILPRSVIEGEYLIKPAVNNSNFHFRENEKGKLTIFEKGNPVLTYNFGMQLDDGIPERYRRSSYIHPIFDLNGNVITDDFPSDHYHHRGISLMWPKVFVDSVRYDLWHIYGQQGALNSIHQIFEKWIYKEAGPVCAQLGVKNYWKLEDGPVVMDEWIDLCVYKTGELYRTIDIKIKLRAKTNIVLEGQTKKGYGGLNVRFAPREETRITSQFGREEDSDMKNLPWADLSAKFVGNDYFSGITLIQRENNNDFPAGWCLRHYGFLGVAWPGITKYSMNPGDILTLSFRLLIHHGESNKSDISQLYNIFQNPPKLSAQKNSTEGVK